MLGYIEKNFRHNRRYAEVGVTMREASARYLADVRAKDFPTKANAAAMPQDVLTRFQAEVVSVPLSPPAGRGLR